MLLLLAAAPADAHWYGGGFWLGLGVGTLLTAPLWAPYAYASPYYYPYPYPYYYPYYPPYPAYASPAPPAGSVPPAATPTTPTPSLLTPSPPETGGPAPPAVREGTAGQTCDAVWVEGHYETHIRPGGQGVTVRIPGASQQICR
jgi:hypothetical protein